MENKNSNTALLVMDMIAGIASNYPQVGSIEQNIAQAITYARNKNIQVIYVALSFREGTPEISSNNKTFSNTRQRFADAKLEDFSKIVPSLAPTKNEITVYKKRVSAFTGSDLEIVLRSQNIQHLVLTGISTSGVVLSTLREAADKDYRITVLSDCCVDPDPEIHQLLTHKVFPRQADVLKMEEWCK